MPELAYLSLGSNTGARREHLREAIRRLETVGKTVAVSSFYETEPVEYTDQPWFLNCAVGLETDAPPTELMASLLRIERDMGRERTQTRKGPRLIDIDILLLGNSIINSEELTLPHPAMQQRRFVLEPLAEIAPDALHPVFQRTVRQLRDSLPVGQVVRKCSD
jgi:2-amino-4-hydroxy-6-hydroxymethyldihydropteridine diphosphokinase